MHILLISILCDGIFEKVPLHTFDTRSNKIVQNLIYSADKVSLCHKMFPTIVVIHNMQNFREIEPMNNKSPKIG